MVRIRFKETLSSKAAAGDFKLADSRVRWLHAAK
jgi:hypothetical protein